MMEPSERLGRSEPSTRQPRLSGALACGLLGGSLWCGGCIAAPGTDVPPGRTTDAAQATPGTGAGSGPTGHADSGAGPLVDASIGGSVSPDDASFGGGGFFGLDASFGGFFGLDANFGGLFGGNGGSVVPGPCYDDEDGLLESLERDAGLDPCKADSDGDRCSDADELLLGGCGDARNALAWNVCFEGHYAARVQFTAPARDAGTWPKLTLTAQIDDLLIAAQPNAQDALAASGASFLSVPAGAPLNFALELPGTFQPYSSLTLKLTSEDGRVLDQGKLIVVSRPCPLVI